MSTDHPDAKPCPVCRGELPAVLTCQTCDATGDDLEAALLVIRGNAATQLATIDERQQQRIERALAAALQRHPEIAERPAEVALLRQSITGIVKNTPEGTTAHELVRSGDPETHIVPRWRVGAERVAEVDQHALAQHFHDMSKFPTPPAPDSTTRQREAIGRAIAEYMSNARSGEDADVVAGRIVAALGPVEAWGVADVLGKWVGAIAAACEAAEGMGLRR